jgi:hypothetical protein
MNRKVYIPHVVTRYDSVLQCRVPVIDLTPARDYGEFVMLLDPEFRLNANDASLHEAFETVRDGARAITPDDYILCSGDVALTAVTIATACKAHGKCNLLRWDKMRREYDQLEVAL